MSPNRRRKRVPGEAKHGVDSRYIAGRREAKAAGKIKDPRPKCEARIVSWIRVRTIANLIGNEGPCPRRARRIFPYWDVESGLQRGIHLCEDHAKAFEAARDRLARTPAVEAEPEPEGAPAFDEIPEPRDTYRGGRWLRPRTAELTREQERRIERRVLKHVARQLQKERVKTERRRAILRERAARKAALTES